MAVGCLHSEPFSPDACSVVNFIFLSSCMLLTFGFFLILFLSFPETNLGSAEKASVKDDTHSS